MLPIVRANLAGAMISYGGDPTGAAVVSRVSFGLRPVVRALDMLVVVERDCCGYGCGCGCGCEVYFVVGERVGAAQAEGKLKAARA
jgi:anaerobic selenocysteine-containing dehydrogenase